MQQQTPEWYAARLGKVTASRTADVMAKTKTGYSASRANYMASLIVERLTGQQADFFESEPMIWGRETEPQARAAYTFLHDIPIIECGFIEHEKIGSFGASPDGLIGEEGLVEVKCPNTATHLEFLLSKTIPGKYITQMQTQMACTNRQWCDFVSFDPRLPEPMQLWIFRVKRDDEAILRIEIEVEEFLAEIDAKMKSLQADYGMAA